MTRFLDVVNASWDAIRPEDKMMKLAYAGLGFAFVPTVTHLQWTAGALTVVLLALKIYFILKNGGK